MNANMSSPLRTLSQVSHKHTSKSPSMIWPKLVLYIQTIDNDKGSHCTNSDIHVVQGDPPDIIIFQSTLQSCLKYLNEK